MIEPDELSARLHELAGSVRVERMSPASVQRRVRERARGRRLRRGLASALAAVVLFAGASSWSAHQASTTRVLTDGPVAPAAPAAVPPAPVPTLGISPSTTSTTPAPAPKTTIQSRPEDEREGRERDLRTDPTTRGEPADPGPRSK